MKFLGIDFGWTSGASGLCCLEWENDRLQLVDFDRRETLEDVLDWVDVTAPIPEAAIVAVDAPTLIPNATGMRLCDRLAHKHFGRYHAGCYPANQNSRFADRTVGFGKSLEVRGFAHAPTIETRGGDRYQIEVFPHPAIVNLFNLERILKYKKGKLAERKLELAKLQQYIVNILSVREPKLDLLEPQRRRERREEESFDRMNCDLSALSGSNLKAVEDQLDALICAYVAAHWWYWGSEKNLVLGDRIGGYIVIPARF